MGSAPQARSEVVLPASLCGKPVNEEPPFISGDATVGGTLLSDAGEWASCEHPMLFLGQWFRDGVAIEASYEFDYTVTADDAGAVIYFELTAGNSHGLSDPARSNSLQIASAGDEVGELEDDQAAEGGDDTTSNPASADPVSPTGPVPPGSYTTELWGADETATEDGLFVVSSTAFGTSAITGVVNDAVTDVPLASASVVLSNGTSSVTTTTNSVGAYAFIDIPAGIYELAISAPGHGLYRYVNMALDANETYQVTSAPGTEPETLDESNDAAMAETQAVTNPGTAHSQVHVPPLLNVGMYDVWREGTPGGLNCRPKTDDPQAFVVRRWPLRYYLLRVAQEEVEPPNYNDVGQKAFFALTQNYAWIHATIPGSFDVKNSALHQCFRDVKVPKERRWRLLLEDVLGERLVRPNGNLLETRYLAGDPPPPGQPPPCEDPSAEIGFRTGIAGQWNIKALTEENCPRKTDWREVVKHFYEVGARFVPVVRPPVPVADFDANGSNIKYTFTSKSRGRNVAWFFRVQRRMSNGQWRRVVSTITFQFHNENATPRCTWAARTVPNCLVYTPPTGCYRYRVIAGNPGAGGATSPQWSLPGKIRGLGPQQGLNKDGVCNL